MEEKQTIEKRTRYLSLQRQVTNSSFPDGLAYWKHKALFLATIIIVCSYGTTGGTFVKTYRLL